MQVPYSPFFGAKVVKLADPNTAVVGTFHILPYGAASRHGNRLLGSYLKKNLQRFDQIISVSQPAADFARDTFKIDTAVIPNAVDTAHFKSTQPLLKNDELRLLFLGRLVKRKGAQQLLAALAKLQKADQLPKNLKVDICGPGGLRIQLEKYVVDNHLDSCVSFHGFVSDAKKIEFMQSADIAIFPSLAGESFGIVLIEAMAAGSTVVLGGDNPGYRSVLGEIPHSIVDAHDSNILAQQLLEIMTNPDMRAEIHRLQQEHVKRFDVNVVGRQLVEVYDACKTARISQ